MAVRVDADYNARTWDGLVIAGFEACDGPVSEGQPALAVQVDDQLVADAIIERFDVTKRLVYLRVKWDTLRDDQRPEPATWVVAVSPTANFFGVDYQGSSTVQLVVKPAEIKSIELVGS
jgi:hypothetical protein